MRTTYTINTTGECAKGLLAAAVTLQDELACARYRADGRREQSLMARGALRILLERQTGVAAGDWLLERAADGGVQARLPGGEAGPSVSLSHSGDWIAVAVSDEGEIGIDIERRRPRDFAAIAGSVYGPQEQAAVAENGEAAFYRIWTLREAAYKAVLGRKPITLAPVDSFAAPVQDETLVSALSERFLVSSVVALDYVMSWAVHLPL